jgi:hypothetical protein
VDQDQAEGWDASLKDLRPGAPDFAAKVERLLMSADTTREEGMKQKLAILTWLAERDLYPQTVPQLNRVAMDAVALAGRFDRCPAEWDTLIATCDYFAQRIPKDPSVLGVCRTELQVIKQLGKTPGLAAALQKEWAADEAEAAKLDPDNWMGVLARHHSGILKLLHLYEAKAKAKPKK